MDGFREWLLLQEASIVDRAVLDSYERAFRQSLNALVQRTKDPALKKTFEGMKNCPIHDSSGACRSWTDYILGALIRHGCHRTVDPEEALQYVAFNMLSGVGEKGQHRKGLFDFDEDRPFNLQQGNPLEVLFKIYLANSLRTVCSQKLARFRTLHRPKGTLTIGQGHADKGTISPNEIPARPSTGEQEMLEDIFMLLKKRSTPRLDLVALFQSILNGDGTREQRRRFGHDKANEGRKIIVKTIEDYAHKTQNVHLLKLLDNFKNFSATKPNAKKRPKRPPKPKSNLPPDVQDYLSIIDVIEKSRGRASMAVLGKKRRRWLERPPRNPNSPHKTRLHDVLARMVDDGVLARHGAAYVFGSQYETFMAMPQIKAGSST